MRYALALLALCGLSAANAADFEQLTLRDGRTLVGQYDEQRGVLVMENPHAEVHVDARDVAKREPAEAPAVKAKPDAAAPSPAPAVSDVDDLRSVDAKIAELNAQAAALQQQGVQLKVDFARRWLLAANLDPAVRPKMDGDPTRSQMEHDKLLEALNRRLVDLRGVRTRLSKGVPSYSFERSDEYRMVDMFIHDEVFALYQETRAPGKHEPAPTVVAPEHESRPKGRK